MAEPEVRYVNVRSIRLPAMDGAGGDQAVNALNIGLSSVIAGHPQAITTYEFYEVIDAYLGPWGDQGYPIGYGKFYNLAFTRSAKQPRNS